MPWERCDVIKDYSGAFCRLEAPCKRILFNVHALRVFGNAKYLVAYVDVEKRLMAFDILHAFEVGCSKITVKSKSSAAGVVNTNLVRKLLAAGLENGHKFTLSSFNEKQVVFKWQ